MPRSRMLAGEVPRDFTLSPAQEGFYLETAAQPLPDVAILCLDRGLRISEALNLKWEDVHLTPVNGARFGYVRGSAGKSRYSRRNVPLTDRGRSMFEARKTDSPWVFPHRHGRPYRVSSLDHQHKELRALLKLPDDFVIRLLRHTFGTRLGQAGVDMFTITRIRGHRSVVVSPRYVHPTPAAVQRAFECLEAMNGEAPNRLWESQKRRLPATIPATL